jgi:hypothetical protein
MNRRERLERKLEKRREWAEKREADAASRFSAAGKATDGIPFGQPILVGHYSETWHRSALARHDANMRKGCESKDMAKHHESKAAGLASQLENSIYSDDQDALVRLAEHIAELEGERERNNAINKIVRAKPRAKLTDEKIADLVALGMSDATARMLFEHVPGHGMGISSYVNRNLSGNISRLRVRAKDIERRQARIADATVNGGICIEGDEWIRITFSDKPERGILTALKTAGFRWGGGSWTGRRDNLPASVSVDASDRAE